MSSLLVKIFFSPLIMSHGLGINYRLRVEISCSWKDLWFHARNKRGAVDKVIVTLDKWDLNQAMLIISFGFIRVLHLVTWLSLSHFLLCLCCYLKEEFLIIVSGCWLCFIIVSIPLFMNSLFLSFDG
jgi:hypothetical protein